LYWLTLVVEQQKKQQVYLKNNGKKYSSNI
jgi:hypothetical protein